MKRLKRVINASGKMSIIGVSTLDQEVIEAMAYGGAHYFEMSELVKAAGEQIAKDCGFESAYIVSSASGGIVQAVAASIAKDDPSLYLKPFKEHGKRNIILPKGHNVDFGAPIEIMIQAGGGHVIEAGYSNRCSVDDVEAMIDDQCAALMFVKSHHANQKSMLSLEEMSNLAKKYHLPFIIDAAAESSFEPFRSIDFDFLIFSGAKAIEGPSSGIVFTHKTSYLWMLHQAKGLGRAMKIGKENIWGLVCAVKRFTQSAPLSVEVQRDRINLLNSVLDGCPGIKCSMVQDESGRAIYRARLSVKDGVALAQGLKESDPAIYTRDYHKNEGIIDIDVRSLNEEEIIEIVHKVKEIVACE